MTHSDDDGLICPPRLAPQHVVIMPIYRKEEDKAKVLEYCHSLKRQLSEIYFHEDKLRVHIDDRDIRGGEKAWGYIKKGVPIRLEVGPRDMEKDAVFMGRRDLSPKDKKGMDRTEFVSSVVSILDEIQKGLYDRALKTARKIHETSIPSKNFESTSLPRMQINLKFTVDLHVFIGWMIRLLKKSLKN